MLAWLPLVNQALNSSPREENENSRQIQVLEKQDVKMIPRVVSAVDYCKMFMTSKLGNHSGCCIKQCPVLFSKVGSVTLSVLELLLIFYFYLCDAGDQIQGLVQQGRCSLTPSYIPNCYFNSFQLASAC